MFKLNPRSCGVFGVNLRDIEEVEAVRVLSSNSSTLGILWPIRQSRGSLCTGRIRLLLRRCFVPEIDVIQWSVGGVDVEFSSKGE